MGNAMLKQAKKIVDVEIVRLGEQLLIPESMSYDDALLTIQRRKDYEEQDTALNVVIESFVWDAAMAFHRALSQKFGWTNMVPTPGFFGDNPPTMIDVAVGHGQSVQIPWGRLIVPGVEGFLQTEVHEKNGRYYFKIGGVVKRKHEAQVQELADLTRKFLREESIYRGKAIRMKFRDDSGDIMPMPEPKFLDLSGVHRSELIYSERLMASVQTNLFTPVERTAECRKAGIPLKRGVLLAGPYGTGKTLAAYNMAALCEQHGWTFLLVERADELPEAIRLAADYAPAVIFTEDIDQVLSGDRSIAMNDILNLVDGVESKGKELMCVFTTNEVENINQAMLRPGRLDAVLYVEPPDAVAVQKLIRLYGRELIDPQEDLSEVGVLMAGNIPAVIREMVERSKLAAISLALPGDRFQISAAALQVSAETMKMQLDLLQPKVEDRRSNSEKAASITARSIETLAEAYRSHAHGNGNGASSAVGSLAAVGQRSGGLGSDSPETLKDLL